MASLVANVSDWASDLFRNARPPQRAMQAQALSPTLPHSPRSQARVSWAEEPWADETRPLIDESKDPRPVRKSKRSVPQSSWSHSSRLDDIDEGHSNSRRAYLCLGALALLLLFTLSLALYLGRPTPLPRYPVPQPTFPPTHYDHPVVLIQAQNGAVATENILCSDIGVQILKDGGNAVDAAIASTICIGVVNMFSSGIGGGGFMTIRVPPTSEHATSTVYTIDFRETAPAASNATMFNRDPTTSMFGGLSVGVPGELRGLEAAHKRWGKLPWKRLVQPSADLANGWIVGPELARRIQLFAARMLNESDWSAVFAPEGELLVEGDPISRKSLAKTLDAIANHGADAFYQGPIADAMLAKISATGGIMTQEDLDAYQVRITKALEGIYRGRKIYTTGAPTSGAVLLHMLNLIEQIPDFLEDGRTGLNTHRMVEALKFGFAARTKISDPTTKQDAARMEHISSKSFAAKVFGNFTDDTTHPAEYYNPIYDVPFDHGTSHSSIVDKNGMAVSITSTINLVFGSGVLDPVTGVIFNDEMDDFSKPGMPNYFGLWPSPYNYPAPDKRPLSSTAPTIVEDADGNFEMALGGSGGSRIFGTIFQVLLGADWGLDISEAIEYPRLHDQLFPTLVDIDTGYPEEGLEALRMRGHNITVQDKFRIAAVVQGVTMKNGTIYAASDSRKNGIAAGY